MYPGRKEKSKKDGHKKTGDSPVETSPNKDGE